MILSRHSFIRIVKQGRTDSPVSCLTNDAAVTQGYSALVAAPWKETSDLAATLPRHNWAQTGHEDNYDAYAFCGDYANGSQHVYMGAVDYCVEIPIDARVGAACTITGLTITAYGDRYLASGAILCAIPSSSSLPPTWDEVLASTNKTAASMAVIPSNTGTDSTATLTITFASPPTATTFLHLILRIVDYEVHRGAWIEGGAMLDGNSLSIEYSRTVLADETTSCPVLGVSRVEVQPDGTLLTKTGWDQIWRSVGVANSNEATSLQTQAAIWSTALGVFPSNALEKVTPVTLGGDNPLGAYLQLDEDYSASCYASARFFSLGQTDGRILKSFCFDRAIPAPDLYTRVRMAVYAVTGVSGTGTIGDIDTISIATPAFWSGDATLVSIGSASYSVRSLLKLTIRGTVPEDYIFPVTHQSTVPTLLLLVTSMCRMCASPGFTIGTRYGLQFAPDIINLTE